MCWLEITRLQYGCGTRASGVSSKTYTCRAFQHYSRRKREYEAQHGNDTFAEQSPHEISVPSLQQEHMHSGLELRTLGHDMRCSYQATSSHKSDSEDERF
ncbi:hypothetical protein L208DRAFT_732604 [Tricholoma matsutake]|nr:hypothetical protein L208DRAFT_732604 [Tricholoma matsutake 945]